MSIKIIADMHIHTHVSQHAFSSVTENAVHAAKIGLKAIAFTDHGPNLGDGATLWHFGGQGCLPDYMEGVRVYKGVEANIISFDGELDIPDEFTKWLDWVIASFHEPALRPGNVEECTRAWLNIAKNPYIDVIGHCGSENYKFDYDAVIKAFAENDKIVEINNHSFAVRRGAAENCREIALKCKKYGAKVCINSDAHIHYDIGDVPLAIKMLEEIDFPPELVLNSSFEKLSQWIEAKKQIKSSAANVK